MASEERKFEQVLDSLAQKEKRAQHRATLLTVLTLMIGLLLMAGFSWQVIRLRKTRTALEQDVKDLEIKKAQATDELNKTKDALDTAKKQVEENKKDFKDIVKNIDARRLDQAKEIAVKGIESDQTIKPPPPQTPPTVRYYNGDAPLLHLTLSIENDERHLHAECISLTPRNTGGRVNVATFRAVPVSQELVSLTLVPLNAGRIIRGRRVFDANVYAEGEIMRVALVRIAPLR